MNMFAQFNFCMSLGKSGARSASGAPKGKAIKQPIVSWSEPYGSERPL